MRELFPKNNSTDILGKDSDIVKKEDLLPITEQLQNTIQQLNILSDSLSQYETDNTQAINTTQLNAINAAIQSLEAVNSELATAEVDNLTVSSLAQLTTLTVQLATIIDSFTAPSGIINQLQSQEITVGQLNVQNISAVAAEIGEWSVSNLTTTNLTANNKITTSAFESNASDLGVATANSLVVSGNASIGGNLSTGDIDAENVEADEMGIAILLHMLARHSGLIANELVVVKNNFHCYDRHVDIIRQIAENPEYPAPKFWLNPEKRVPISMKHWIII